MNPRELAEKLKKKIEEGLTEDQRNNFSCLINETDELYFVFANDAKNTLYRNAIKLALEKENVKCSTHTQPFLKYPAIQFNLAQKTESDWEQIGKQLNAAVLEVQSILTSEDLPGMTPEISALRKKCISRMGKTSFSQIETEDFTEIGKCLYDNNQKKLALHYQLLAWTYHNEFFETSVQNQNLRKEMANCIEALANTLKDLDYTDASNKFSKKAKDIRSVETLFKLSPHTSVLRKINSPNEVFVRYHIPPENTKKVSALVAHHRRAGCHPNILMSLLAFKHEDKSVDVDMEHASAGPLMVFLSRFDPQHRVSIAKSIARQAAESLLYTSIVHQQQHRDINPRTVLLRIDGCLKLDLCDMVDITTVEQNPELFLTTPYLAPEYQLDERVTHKEIHKAAKKYLGMMNDDGSDSETIKHDEKADVWSLGVLILAILKGTPYRSQAKPSRPNEDAHYYTIQDHILHTQEKAHLKALLKTPHNDPLWAKEIPDNDLRHMVQRCLEVNPNKRASLAEIAEIMDRQDSNHHQAHVTPAKIQLKEFNSTNYKAFEDPWSHNTENDLERLMSAILNDILKNQKLSLEIIAHPWVTSKHIKQDPNYLAQFITNPLHEKTVSAKPDILTNVTSRLNEFLTITADSQYKQLQQDVFEECISSPCEKLSHLMQNPRLLIEKILNNNASIFEILQKTPTLLQEIKTTSPLLIAIGKNPALMNELHSCFEHIRKNITEHPEFLYEEEMEKYRKILMQKLESKSTTLTSTNLLKLPFETGLVRNPKDLLTEEIEQNSDKLKKRLSDKKAALQQRITTDPETAVAIQTNAGLLIPLLLDEISKNPSLLQANIKDNNHLLEKIIDNHQAAEPIGKISYFKMAVTMPHTLKDIAKTPGALSKITDDPTKLLNEIIGNAQTPIKNNDAIDIVDLLLKSNQLSINALLEWHKKKRAGAGANFSIGYYERLLREVIRKQEVPAWEVLKFGIEVAQKRRKESGMRQENVGTPYQNVVVPLATAAAAAHNQDLHKKPQKEEEPVAARDTQQAIEAAYANNPMAAAGGSQKRKLTPEEEEELKADMMPADAKKNILTAQACQPTNTPPAALDATQAQPNDETAASAASHGLFKKQKEQPSSTEDRKPDQQPKSDT